MPIPSSSVKDLSVEGTVTRLLVSVKKLLESLTSWGEGKVDEQYVSDLYVELGDNFKEAMEAFGQLGIDVSDLMSVPDDLRRVLEECLAEEASTPNLQKYLPDVRRVITVLLQGLKNKQTEYRAIVGTVAESG